GLAYDDFGAGQARLLELDEVPPDVISFDKKLIRDVTSSESPRYRMLDSLVTMVADLGVRTLIEGVETELAARISRDLGVDYLQGYFFGYPEPILMADETAYHHSENDSAP
ncbi:MAG: EAL domain-containing protein, partial [Wenzhouxiangella sp.]